MYSIAPPITNTQTPCSCMRRGGGERSGATKYLGRNVTQGIVRIFSPLRRLVAWQMEAGGMDAVGESGSGREGGVRCLVMARGGRERVTTVSS